MENIGDDERSLTGFFKHMTSMSSGEYGSVLNLIQYTILAIIPVVLLLRLQREVVEDPDPTKSTVELILECALQIISVVVALAFIDRAIRYVPTYSGETYPSSALLPGILPLLFAILTMQTKLGEKLNIIYTRLTGQSSENNAGPQPKKEPIFTTPGIENMALHSDEEGEGRTPAPPPPSKDPVSKSPTPQSVEQGAEPMAANESLGGYSSW